MFKLDEFMGKRILKSSLIEDDSIVAFFTTRDLPLKAGEREDYIEQVEQNKRLVCKGLNIPIENLIIPQQIHSDNIAVVKETASRFTLHASHLENTDALITSQHNIALALNFADCVPIIFYDPIKKVVASAHAGWRGTVAQIGIKTVQKMVNEFGSKPSDIIALIGPSIGKCCFEVKEDVMKELKASCEWNAPSPQPSPRRGEGESEIFSDFHADLKLVNKLQLLAGGLKKIDVCEYCTSCANELFFSYRREHGNTARHSAVIMLK